MPETPPAYEELQMVCSFCGQSPCRCGDTACIACSSIPCTCPARPGDGTVQVSIVDAKTAPIAPADRSYTQLLEFAARLDDPPPPASPSPRRVLRRRRPLSPP